jgi:hypothetical protein
VNEVVPLPTLQDILISDRLFRERRHAEWTDNYLLHRLRVITNRLTQRQSINVPYVKETLRTLVARTATPPDLYFENLASDKQRELLMNEYWLECARRNKTTLLDIVDRKQEGLYGRSFMKVTVQDGHILLTVLDPQDVLLDRFMKPWDISTARHVTHVGIYKTISELERNPLYDPNIVKELKAFFQTKAGIVKSNDNAAIIAARNERLRDLGVPDIQDPKVQETYVEVNETQIKVFDEKEGRDHVWVVPTAENRKLGELKMTDVLGVDRFIIATWAGDLEATDIWSDGAADIARPMNQIANVRVSQKAENGTLMNFGMHFYNVTGKEDWRPGGYEPAPWGFYPFPGDPNKDMRRVDVPEMADVFQELDWYKAQIESATAANAVMKGDAEQTAQTATEIQILAQQAARRINAGQPVVELYWNDIGELFSEIVNANPDLLKPVTLHKKGQSGKVYPRTIKPAELVEKQGWKVRVTSKAKKDAEALETLQKFSVAKAQFPGNVPLDRIMQEKTLGWLDLKPEEARAVIEYQAQNPAPPMGADGKPLPAPVPAPVAQPKPAIPANV